MKPSTGAVVDGRFVKTLPQHFCVIPASCVLPCENRSGWFPFRVDSDQAMPKRRRRSIVDYFSFRRFFQDNVDRRRDLFNSLISIDHRAAGI
jgi:hypothetical protein